MASSTDYKNLTSYVNAETINISSTDNFEENMSLDLVYSITDPNRDYPRVNMVVNFSDGPNDGTTTNNLVFRGLVTSLTKSKLGKDKVTIRIDCDGFENVLTRSIIGSSGSVSGLTAGRYVRNIVNNIPNLGVGVIEEGMPLYQYNAFGDNCRTVLNDLAEMSGFTWWIDLLNKLHFRKDKPVEYCVFTIDSTNTLSNRDKLIFDVSVDENLIDYSNQVLMIGSQLEDGGFLYSLKSNVSEINRMKLNYGNGVFSTTITNGAITSQSDLDIACQNTLDRMSTRIIKLSYGTHNSGHRVGEVIKVTLPEFGYNNSDFVITSVNINYRSVEGMTYNIVAYLRNNVVSVALAKKAWVDKFAGMVNKNALPTSLRPFDGSGVNMVFTDNINTDEYFTNYMRSFVNIEVTDNMTANTQIENVVPFVEVINTDTNFSRFYVEFVNEVITDSINIDVV
jgi:hypothetical protein